MLVVKLRRIRDVKNSPTYCYNPGVTVVLRKFTVTCDYGCYNFSQPPVTLAGGWYFTPNTRWTGYKYISEFLMNTIFYDLYRNYMQVYRFSIFIINKQVRVYIYNIRLTYKVVLFKWNWTNIIVYSSITDDYVSHL